MSVVVVIKFVTEDGEAISQQCELPEHRLFSDEPFLVMIQRLRERYKSNLEVPEDKKVVE